MSLLRFPLAVVLLSMSAMSVAACSSPGVDDSSSAQSDLSDSKSTLTSQGFAFVRTETFKYDYFPDGKNAGSGLTCVNSSPGEIAAGGEICYTVSGSGASRIVSGSADRYQHADGRIAYVSQDGRLVGPVRPGRYAGTSPAGSAIIQIKGMRFDDHGLFTLDLSLSLNYTDARQMHEETGDFAVIWAQGQFESDNPGQLLANPGAPLNQIQLTPAGDVAQYFRPTSGDTLPITGMTFTKFVRQAACAPKFVCQLVQNTDCGPDGACTQNYSNSKPFASIDDCRAHCPTAAWPNTNSCVPSLAACH